MGSFEDVFPNTWSALKVVRSGDVNRILALSRLNHIPYVVLEELTTLVRKKNSPFDFASYNEALQNILNGDNPEASQWLLDNSTDSTVRGLPALLGESFREGGYSLKEHVRSALSDKVLHRKISQADETFWQNLSLYSAEFYFIFELYIYNPYFSLKIWNRILEYLGYTPTVKSLLDKPSSQLSFIALEWLLEQAQDDSEDAQSLADYLIHQCDFSKVPFNTQLKFLKALRHRIREALAISSNNSEILFSLAFDPKEFIQEKALENEHITAEIRYVHRLVYDPLTPKNVLKRLLVKYKSKIVGNKLTEIILNNPSMNTQDKKEIIAWEEHSDLKSLPSLSGFLKSRKLKNKKDIAHWIYSFMEKEGLDTLVWQKFKPFVTANMPSLADKLNSFFVQFKGKVTFTELENYLNSLPEADLENNTYISYGKWDTYQRFRDDIPNLVLKLNFKFEYLEKLNKDPEMADLFKRISDVSYVSGHPVVPIPGKTFAWARVTPINKTTWVIDEIQSDLHSAAKVLDSQEEFELSSEKLKEIIKLTENWAEMAISAVISAAKKNGVKDLYIPNKHFKIRQTNMNPKKATELYEKLPSRFHFKKVVTDLGYGEDTFMHRIAKVKTLKTVQKLSKITHCGYCGNKLASTR